MEYITETINSEAVHIWSDPNKVVYIKLGFIEIGQMPESVLNGLIKRYMRLDDEQKECKYNGAEIKTMMLNGKCLVSLSYNNWSCEMWYTTWNYIVLANYKELIKTETYFRTLNKLKQI